MFGVQDYPLDLSVSPRSPGLYRYLVHALTLCVWCVQDYPLDLSVSPRSPGLYRYLVPCFFNPLFGVQDYPLDLSVSPRSRVEVSELRLRQDLHKRPSSTPSPPQLKVYIPPANTHRTLVLPVLKVVNFVSCTYFYRVPLRLTCH
jgi:hypothetical protein